MKRSVELSTYLDGLLSFAGDLLLKFLRSFRRPVLWVLALSLAGLATVTFFLLLWMSNR